MTVKGHSSRHWEKSPGVYENKCQENIGKKVVESRDIAVDVGKKVLEFMKINARSL